MGGLGASNLEKAHCLSAVEALFQALESLVLGLTRRCCPDTFNVEPSVSDIVHNIEPVEGFVRDDLVFLERQLLCHFAVLNLVRRVVVADPLFRIFIQNHADVVASISQDDAGLAVGGNSTTYLGGHLVVLPDVCAVVAHGLSPVRRHPPCPVVANWFGMGY